MLSAIAADEVTSSGFACGLAAGSMRCGFNAGGTADTLYPPKCPIFRRLPPWLLSAVSERRPGDVLGAKPPRSEPRSLICR